MNSIDRAYQYLIDQQYDQAASLYEQAIAADSTQRSAYWYLGLALLLQGQEAEAQMTWLMVMTEGDPAQVDEWTRELAAVLTTEANRQAGLEHLSIAWAVRQHLREVCPEDVNNLLHIVALSLKLETFVPVDLAELGLLERLRQATTTVDADLVLHLLEALLNQYPHPLIIEFADVCRLHVQPEAYVEIVLMGALKVAYLNKLAGMAAYLAEFCRELQPENLDILFELPPFYQNSRQYQKGIDAARQAVSLAQELPDRAFASYLLMRGLMNAGGYWDEAVAALGRHEQILQELLADPPIPLDLIRNSRLNTVSFFFPYFRDTPHRDRPIRQQLFDICRANMQWHNREYFDKYQARHEEWRATPIGDRKLKIGYISHCFHEHSVGWLCRWLLQHHDRDQIELYLYITNYGELSGDSLRPYFLQLADYARPLDANRIKAAEAIFADDLDILVDLDSITLDVTVNILSMKPAPIQVTWLGWDAIGLSTIDYFLADAYVLPEDAQDYYVENIWRLPQTYVAVDGFEVGVPNLRRDELAIPADAVVYFSGQRGYKRHRDTAKLQMQIIQQVPNSYFLIKGIADEASIQQFFYELADKVGVAHSRLRFLPEVSSEAVHRANLAIADIVLDTFPYNGATTTLETLWMGIPLVTRVGEQFAARNSYTMLKNVGIEEGIAWTDAEYVEWGVRLGTDAALRQTIHWQLKNSRHTAPLWNGKQFARDVEAAYREMVDRRMGR
ncbi:MAG: O-linked N-acetylglucosamine transferase, SPINDLY family protein [Leptolyngbyaceae cyanobacterium bins.349]|nr:O-linked N-acetylglucosamine transferase, SPINDLY family protein [Leptolyngbyaceae cyanobacterium bins.349]